MYIELIRIHRPLYYTFPQADTCGNKDCVGEAGFGIQGECNTACADIASYHALYSRRDSYLRMIKVLMHAVSDRPVIEQRGKDFMHCRENVINTPHIEETLLLSGKRSFGQILRGG